MTVTFGGLLLPPPPVPPPPGPLLWLLLGLEPRSDDPGEIGGAFGGRGEFDRLDTVPITMCSLRPISSSLSILTSCSTSSPTSTSSRRLRLRSLSRSRSRSRSVIKSILFSPKEDFRLEFSRTIISSPEPVPLEPDVIESPLLP